MSKKKLKRYSKLGSVTTRRKAVKKQIPRKPIRKEWTGLFVHPYYNCPICERFTPYCESGVTYCACCGQALLWK